MASKEKFLHEFKIVAQMAAEELGYSVLSVTFNVSKTEGRVLKVIIDGKKIGLDTCEFISRKLSEWLDEHGDVVPAADYSLEVSSPGMDKPLKAKDDFERLIGKLINIETKTKADDGRKRYSGRLKRIVDGAAVIYVEKESTEFVIPLDNVAKARAEYDFREE